MRKERNNTKPFYNRTIPSDWTNPEFGTVFSFLKSFSFSRDQLTKEKTNDDIRNIHYGDIHATYENEILDFEVEQRVPFLKDGFLDVKKFDNEEFPALQDGDLIIADASEDFEGVCNCVELKNINGRKVVSGLHTFAARGNVDIIVVGFRTYALNNQQVVRELRRIATGISVYGVSKTNLSKVILPLPPPSDQRAIAHVLSLMDSAINQNNQLIVQKELRKKWLMQNLLTVKKRLKGFEGEWKEYRIEELFEKVYRYVEWNDKSIYKLVSIRRRFGGLFERGDFFGHQIEVKKIKSIHHNDFLISKRQVSHGAWGIVSPEFHGRKVSDEYDCLIVKNDKKLFIEFWDWYSKMPIMRHHAFLASNGVHIEKLIFDFDTFKRRRIIIPPSKEEQTAIAQVLQAADKEIQLLKAKTEKLREQKKGMMQVLLTGKKRLKINT